SSRARGLKPPFCFIPPWTENQALANEAVSKRDKTSLGGSLSSPHTKPLLTRGPLIGPPNRQFTIGLWICARPEHSSLIWSVSSQLLTFFYLPLTRLNTDKSMLSSAYCRFLQRSR